jgi:hypothetical protein
MPIQTAISGNFPAIVQTGKTRAAGTRLNHHEVAGITVFSSGEAADDPALRLLDRK